jgi:RNA polymerase sigma-70 factor (ECF subfamily)
MEFRRAVEAEIPCLRRYARKLARNDTAVAEDLVQECLMLGLAKQHLWREGSNLRAWLCTILHNQHINEVRRSAREAVVTHLGDLDGMLPHPPPQEKILELRDVSRAMTS